MPTLVNISKTVNFNILDLLNTSESLYQKLSITDINALAQCHTNFVNNLQLNREKSIKDGQFLYKYWHLLIPISDKPLVKNFKILTKNPKNIQIIINCYQKMRPKVSKLKVMSKYKTSVNVLLPTLQDHAVIKYICQISDKLWSKFSASLKYTAWHICIGFYDVLSPVVETVIERSKCDEYFESEVAACRFVPVSEFVHCKNLCAKYFALSEIKVRPNGERYKKIRHVADGPLFNSHVITPAHELSFNFPTAQSLFSDYDMYKILNKCQSVSVFDRSEFYRYILVLPSNISGIVNSRGELFYDLYCKMGHCNSSLFAQLCSTLVDLVWNSDVDEKHGGKCHAVTMQDDTLFLQIGDYKLDPENVFELNCSFGYKINRAKTQLNARIAKWSGYLFDLKRKSLKLPDDKIANMKQLKSNFAKSTMTRRAYASLLGKVYSTRLLSMGNGLNFSSLTTHFRSHMFKDSNLPELRKLHFIKDEVINSHHYKEFFDTKLPIPPLKASEDLDFAIQISQSEVPFYKIRRFIFTLNSFPVVPNVVMENRTYILKVMVYMLYGKIKVLL